MESLNGFSEISLKVTKWILFPTNFILSVEVYSKMKKKTGSILMCICQTIWTFSQFPTTHHTRCFLCLNLCYWILKLEILTGLIFVLIEMLLHTTFWYHLYLLFIYYDNVSFFCCYCCEKITYHLLIMSLLSFEFVIATQTLLMTLVLNTQFNGNFPLDSCFYHLPVRYTLMLICFDHQ